MFFKKIDLLSEVPRVFIFNKSANKTIFGGSLFLIYLIIILLIAVAYLVDFILNDKYQVQYGIHQELLPNETQTEILQKEDYNPVIKFGFDLTYNNKINLLSDRFTLYDDFKGKFIGKNETISSRITDLALAVLYRCENEECSLNDEDFSFFGYQFILKYQGFELDHQGEIPLHKIDHFYHQNSIFFFNTPLIQYFRWGILKYYEENNMLGVLNDLFGEKDNTIIGGYVKESYNYLLDGIFDDSMLYVTIEGNTYRLLGFFFAVVDLMKFEEYKRTKRSIFDVLADITSLAMIILNIFVLFFSYFYSSNFDSYKIIEKILTKGKNMRKFIGNEIKEIKDISESTTDNKITQIELVDNYGKSETLLENNSDLEVKNNNSEEKKDYGENYCKSKEKKFFPKLNFMDFIINNFYTEKCFKISNRQKLISACNDIISRYYTIEDIIYYRILLENLLKDYKWNDPKLNNIDNNEYINELKKYYNI